LLQIFTLVFAAFRDFQTGILIVRKDSPLRQDARNFVKRGAV
jgi:hypothetical protein